MYHVHAYFIRTYTSYINMHRVRTYTSYTYMYCAYSIDVCRIWMCVLTSQTAGATGCLRNRFTAPKTQGVSLQVPVPALHRSGMSALFLTHPVRCPRSDRREGGAVEKPQPFFPPRHGVSNSLRFWRIRKSSKAFHLLFLTNGDTEKREYEESAENASNLDSTTSYGGITFTYIWWKCKLHQQTRHILSTPYELFCVHNKPKVI